tara:strand:- start:987 stop:1277 length:291 start_codon:yes stop_codon:yes gene_type:complete
MKLIHTATIITIAALAACTQPTHYVVDTTPYAEQIKSNPSEVVAKPEHVTPVGSLKIKGGVTVRTDQGEITLSESGLSGGLLIDRRTPPVSGTAGK